MTTAARWADRYRTPTRTERRIIKVRVLHRRGPARIGHLLGLHPSTVHRVLTRYGLAKLRWRNRPTGWVIRRIESARPGVHVDVKKLGKIPAGGGWRMLGRTVGNRNSQADKSSGRHSKRATRCAGTISCIVPWMAIRDWSTPNCWPMSASRPLQHFGQEQMPGSLNAASRCGKY
ncbi:MAG: hypothetical protein NVS4B6_13420 [Mycobacterium sp.]